MQRIIALGAAAFLLAVVTLQAQHSTQQTMAGDTTKMTIARTLNAPVEKIWNAWKEEAAVRRWWGPEGFTCPVAKMDFKVGGKSLVCMRSPDGFEIYNSWTYTAIEPMKSIGFVQRFTDVTGKEIKPSSIGMPPGIPDEVPHLITFKDLGKGKTEILIVESGYGNAQVAEISKGGMASVLNKLAAEVEE